MNLIFAGASTDYCLLALRQTCKSLSEIHCPPALNLVVDQFSALSNFDTAEMFLLEYGINKQDYYSIFRQLISKVLLSKIPEGCSKTIETSHQNYMFYPKLYELFPRANFIFCLRDGRDVVASNFIKQRDSNQKIIDTEEVRDSAIQWLNSIGTGLNGITEIKNLGANTSVVKFEDLLNPSFKNGSISAISECNKTIELDLNLQQSTNQWRSVFNDKQIEVLKDELNEVLKQMGYLQNCPW